MAPPMFDAATAYRMFTDRDPAAAGVILGVISTGIYCRVGCPARMPKFENCRFLPSPLAAQAEGFRACLRCHPDGEPEDAAFEALLRDAEAFAESGEDPIRERDFAARGLSASTVRRRCRERFGESFAAHQRALRLERARRTIAGGESAALAQVDAGYGSASAFREAYAKAYSVSPSGRAAEPLRVAWLPTPLGPLMAVADGRALHMSEFTDRKHLRRQVERVRRLSDRAVVAGRTEVHDWFEGELADYFAGELQAFATPLEPHGTAFQRRVWEGLREIPYGETRSYAELAEGIGSPSAVRAVAGGNAANALAVVVPCHRVVPKEGGVGGYAGGAARKRWLLELESGGVRGA